MSVTKHPYEPDWQIPLGVRAIQDLPGGLHCRGRSQYRGVGGWMGRATGEDPVER